jgi:SAM-dependent methyltransferase
MAQPLVLQLVADLARAVDLPDPVYEFGSLQWEGHDPNDLRPLFPGRPYVGTDFQAGPGVDRVEDLRALTLDSGSVGTALCVDTLEHVEDPPQAVRELTRVVADGGVCLITSVMLFGIHGYPEDYFRFTPEGFRVMLSGFDDVWVTGIGHPDIPTWIVGVGAKGRSLGLSLDSFPSLVAAQQLHDSRPGVKLGVHTFGRREAARAHLRSFRR